MAVIFGISDKHTVMADLDNMSFKRVKSLVFLTMKRFRLDGFIILKSSLKHYHVVFDRPKRWSEVLRIVWKWVCMQAIKKTCTLRVSEKPTKNGFKPKPRIVYRYGSQNRQIKDYLEKRKEVWNILNKVKM